MQFTKRTGIVPLDTKKFLEEVLRDYPEIPDPRQVTREDLLWYQSRRQFILTYLKKIEAQIQKENEGEV